MKKYFYSILFVFVTCFLFMAPVNVSAEDSTEKELDTADLYVYDQEVTKDSMKDKQVVDEIADGPVRKLGRGFSNLIFGFFEIPLKIYYTNMDEGGIAACSFGVVKGLFYFLAREVTGVVEIITFPMPLPGAAKGPFATGWGYGPLMQPEWIFTFESDPYNMVYPDFPVN
ncbi:MAG: exosortase system-associated protein, TIGR04073 family [bacterium]|nr:exosortase system-associated protein, TIGR04073 family [bacterium]